MIESYYWRTELRNDITWLRSHRVYRRWSEKQQVLFERKLMLVAFQVRSLLERPKVLVKDSAYSRFIRKHFINKYPMPKDIPAEEQPYFRHLSEQSEFWFAKVETLVWRQPDMMQESRYLQAVSRAKSIQ